MAAPVELSAELLATPAAHAARVLAIARLNDVKRAMERMSSGDPAALHDFRVTLRRLRTWLRAYRPQLEDTVRKKTMKRLADVASATNGARDVEVALEWVTAVRDLKRRERHGANYIVRRLRREATAVRAEARDTIAADLPGILATLSKQLRPSRHRTGARKRVPDMASVTRRVIEQHADRFALAIQDIRSPRDVAAVHCTRIAAKRLRYMLEMLLPETGAGALVARFAILQDTLGVAHDGYCVTERLVSVVTDLAGLDARRSLRGKPARTNAPRFARIRPGLVALAGRAAGRGRSGFDAFRRRWGKRRIASALSALSVLAQGLSR